MNTIKILTAFIAMTLGTSNCETPGDDGDEPVVSRDTCMKFCFFPLCDGVTEPGEDYGTVCVEQCINKGTDARTVGQQCADAYSRAIGCYIELSCDEFKQWYQGDGTICEAEQGLFTESCPDLTFDFRE